MVRSVRSEIEREGWLRMPGLVGDQVVKELRAAVEANGAVGPVRDAYSLTPLVQAVATSKTVLGVVANVLDGPPFSVRAMWFDKSPGANWPVMWHQDKTIAVQHRINLAGYGPWSSKCGVPHVEPPFAVLDGMVAVRVLVDDCTAQSGPLRVVPGTHRKKRTPQEVEDSHRGGPVIDVTGRAGDAILMRPLMVHGSRRSSAPQPRRVLHLEYAARPLPLPLRWHMALRSEPNNI